MLSSRDFDSLSSEVFVSSVLCLMRSSEFRTSSEPSFAFEASTTMRIIWVVSSAMPYPFPRASVSLRVCSAVRLMKS